MPCQTSSTASTSRPNAWASATLASRAETPIRSAPVASLSKAKRPLASRWSSIAASAPGASARPSVGQPLDHAGRGAACRRRGPAGWSIRLRPEQGHRLGHVADIVPAHVEQDRIDPLLGDRADRRRLDRGQVELAGQRRQRIAAVGIGRALQIIADQLQLGVARARVDERVEQLGEIAHGRGNEGGAGRFAVKRGTRPPSPRWRRDPFWRLSCYVSSGSSFSRSS